MVDRQLQDEILEIARRLFIQHGYHGLSMRAIAEEIGVSKAALYYHFEDKQALFLAILNKSLLEIEALLERCFSVGDTAEAKIGMLIQQIMLQPPENRAVIRLASQELSQLGEDQRQAFESNYQRRFLARLDAVFEQGVASGELRDIQPRLLTWSLLGLMYPYFYNSPIRNLPTQTDLSDQIKLIFFVGIRFSSQGE